MNLRIVIITCVVVCILLVLSPWNPAQRIFRSAQSAQENQAQTDSQLRLHNTIKQGFGDGALKAKEAMEAFLKTWDPIGRSAQEIKAVFGKPSEDKPDSIIYMFDTGFTGWNFEFVLNDGKVVELKRPTSE